MLREVFVYGSLRRDGDAHHLIDPHAGHVRPARLESWGLYGLGRPYPVVAPRDGSVVVGDLVTLSADDPGAVFRMLDEYEGPGYERRVCSVQVPHGRPPAVDAWVYVAAPGAVYADSELIPTGDWLSLGDER